MDWQCGGAGGTSARSSMPTACFVLINRLLNHAKPLGVPDVPALPAMQAANSSSKLEEAKCGTSIAATSSRRGQSRKSWESTARSHWDAPLNLVESCWIYPELCTIACLKSNRVSSELKAKLKLNREKASLLMSSVSSVVVSCCRQERSGRRLCLGGSSAPEADFVNRTHVHTCTTRVTSCYTPCESLADEMLVSENFVVKHFCTRFN